MESVKPEVAQDQILSLLKETLEKPIRELTPLQGGLVAQTLSFKAGDGEYILRFMTGKMDASYQKEAFIYQNFALPEIPIPPVIKVGSLGGLFYCISQKMLGRGLKTIPNDEYEQALPDVIRIAHAIHIADVTRWKGYGWIGDDGSGLFPSWKKFIAHTNEEERAEGFFGKWHVMFDTTFLNRARFDEYYDRMMSLLEACPEDRYLLHGGYGYDNVLARDGRVTAVLDWEAMYGDFAYDIAWIDFWPRGVDHVEMFRRHYAEKGMPLGNYRERIACYKHYIGLDGMKFFAKTNNREAYGYVCQILDKLKI
jgi:hygromycin-B 4-O-kinase